MRSRSHVLAFALVMLVGVGGGSAAFGTGGSAVVVPVGDVLATKSYGQVVVLDQAGKLVRRLHPFTAGVQGIALAPDRAHAYVSFYGSGSGPIPVSPTLYKVDLATGTRSRIGNGVSPSVSPDGTRLAYLAIRVQDDIASLDALDVTDLSNGTTRRIPFISPQAMGTPPELIINWSPDSQRIAVVLTHLLPQAGPIRVIHLVDPEHAQAIDSEPIGSSSTGVSWTPMAPAYLNANTLVIEPQCCIGQQPLVTQKIGSTHQAPFAMLSSPPKSIVRIGAGRLLVATMLNELVLVSKGQSKVIATDIGVATG